ncbi:hypothetical protein Q7P37_002210 [Cladosporium fusiforme]
MATATDIITYVGVPLAVAGVLPLLWNAFMAIRIWLRLRESLPARVRHLYSFLVDPAAGKVTVVARMPHLNSPGLDQLRGVSRRQVRRTRSLTRSLTGTLDQNNPPSSQAEEDDYGPSPFHVRKGPGLHRTWMSLAELMGLDLPVLYDEHGDVAQEARFAVESDMKASDATPLAMDWAHFVWMALCLGVGPYDPGWSSWQKMPSTLKGGNGENIINLSRDTSGEITARLLPTTTTTYSLRKALAWHQVRIENGNLMPLGRANDLQMPLSSVRLTPGLAATRSPMEKGFQWDNAIGGKDIYDCEQPLVVAACTWMLYRCKYGGESLPISERMLEYRQRVLCSLKRLDRERKLEIMIHLLFLKGSQSRLSEERDDTTNPAAHPGAKEPTEHSNPSCMNTNSLHSTTSPGQELPSSDVARKSDTQAGEASTPTAAPEQSVTEKATPPQRKDNDPGDTGIPNGSIDAKLKIPKVSANDDDTTTVILRTLRLAFAASDYVRNYATFVDFVEKAVKTYKEVFEGIPLKLALRRSWYYLQTIEEGLQKLDSRVRDEIRRRETTLDLHALLPRRMQELEETLRLATSNPAACNVKWDDMYDEKAFLGCIALATADWDGLSEQEWQLREDLSDKLVKKLNKNVATMLDVKALIDLALRLDKEGMYVAPENPVSQMLGAEKNRVFLL